MKQAGLLLMKSSLIPGEFAIQCEPSLSPVFQYSFLGFFYFYFYEEPCSFVSTDISF